MDFSLEILDTPNPNAKIFKTNKILIADGSLQEHNSDSCSSILFKDILNLAGVRQIFVEDTSITVTISEHAPWSILEKRIANSFQKLLEDHDPESDGYIYQLDDNNLRQIDDILENKIRPVLKRDGGNVEVVKLENNVLTIKYYGACRGCIQSTKGTLDAITALLRIEYDKNLEVKLS